MAPLAPIEPKLTVRDYLALPEDGQRYELIEGELYMQPAPNEFHQFASHRLTLLLGNHLEESQEGILFAAPFDVFLEELTVVQPDLLVVTHEHDDLIDGGLQGTPDLVVEILSPSNATHDLVRKRALYREHEVPEIWIVDPVAKTIVVDRLGEGGYGPEVLHKLGDTLTTPLLPGLIVPLDRVFAIPWKKRPQT
jgi:Uma2 family endonuclease